MSRRIEAAEWVSEARERFAASGSYEVFGRPSVLLLDEEAIIAGWDADLDRLLTEAIESRAGEQTVELPGTLSASAVLRLNAEPAVFTAELARPMPRPPSRAARFGNRFHCLGGVPFRFAVPNGSLGQQSLVDPDDLPDRADAGTEDEAELREMCERFLAGRFGQTVPYAIEAPFTLLLPGRLIRGRIDAVYRLGDEGRTVPIPGGGLEDEPCRERGSVAIGDLPAGVGGDARPSARVGGRDLLLRPLRPCRSS